MHMGMPRATHQLAPLVDKRVLRPAQTALALQALSRMDLLRLKTIARIYARGLPSEGAWEDMLQEAITRVFAGSRQCPEGLTMVAFVAGILRSLRADYWRRVRRESGGDISRIKHENDDAHAIDLVDPAPGPERTVEARQQLALIKLLFADDPAALKIIEGLCDGLSAEQIRFSTGLSRTDYDSTRRRMRRAVLREGLTCEAK
jgi:DNA-directed RNA polymerase specialized sigma24 family protein